LTRYHCTGTCANAASIHLYLPVGGGDVACEPKRLDCINASIPPATTTRSAATTAPAVSSGQRPEWANRTCSSGRRARYGI
jgi:hypothetical protein